MADSPAESGKKEQAKRTRRMRKPAQTVRERTQVSSAREQKPRRLRRTATTAARPFRAVGRGTKRAARPLGVVLWPFRTRPMRFIGRVLAAILLFKYFRGSWQELRQVAWPSRRDTWKLTAAVFLFAILFGLIISVTDYGLDKLFKKVLLS